MTAARDTRLRAVVAEAAFPSLQHAMEARCRFFAGPLARTITHPIRWWARRWIDFHPRDVAPLDVIGQAIARRVAHEQALLLDAIARVAATSVGIGFDSDETLGQAPRGKQPPCPPREADETVRFPRSIAETVASWTVTLSSSRSRSRSWWPTVVVSIRSVATWYSSGWNVW